MAKLNLTRDQLALFLTDQQQIRQFELLFSTVDQLQVIVGTNFEYQADTATATANEALAQIGALAQDTAVDDAVLNAKVQQSLDAITSLARALEFLLLAPRQEIGTIASQNAKNVAITGGTINGTSIGATTPSTVTATTLVVNDNTTLGSSNTDTIDFVGRVNSDFEPATDNTYDLGRVGHEWRNLYIDGTANIDNLVADTAAITGGTINNTAIGGTTPAAGTFTTLTATGDSNLNGNVFLGNGSNNFWRVQGSSSIINISGQGTTANINQYIISKGSGSTWFSTGSLGGNAQMAVSHTASAVNYVQVTGAATGVNPSVSAQGSDASIGLELTAKGGAINFRNNGVGTAIQFATSFTASTVNYLTVTGSGVSGNAPRLFAQGSDTNISQVFQSKGTGAINLAPGSRGVNISNGGTVTALTRTAAGTGYTTIPSVAVSAPTTAGGVQATASVTTMFVLGGTLASGGTGYTVGDTLTVVGGTTGAAATVTVNAVSGGVITSASVIAGANYTVLPTNPVSVTGGTGSGATFNLTYGVSATGVTITNAGSGYVEQPTVTFSGGGGSGAAAYATVGASSTIKQLGGSLGFSGSSGEVFRIYDFGGQAGVGVRGHTLSGIPPAIFPTPSNGSQTNISFEIASLGTGAIQLATGGGISAGAFNQIRQLNVAHTASAVNFVQVTGAATGGIPIISAQGSNTNVSLRFQSKGASGFLFTTGAGTQFIVQNIAGTAINQLQAQGSATGNAVTLSSVGTDTNIDLALTPKGTGNVRFGTYTADMTLIVQGYIEIKDSGGTIRKLAVIA
jgi:hypothetical protein